jgi:hypothetical protein
LPSVITRKKIRTLSALVTAAALAACALGSASTASAASCPSFRVLHNDRIGAASFPAGSYAMTANTDAAVSCAAASKLFTRFLSDYDGILPRPWRIVAEGSGKASFKKGALVGFSVSRGGGEGGGNNSLGALCSGSYTVNAGRLVGPLRFVRGSYLLYIPPGSRIKCRTATVLFTRFLSTPGGQLPPPWRVNTQTATFFKAGHATRSAFRVEPLSGAGPA